MQHRRATGVFAAERVSEKIWKNFVCTENLQLHVTFSSFVFSHSFCCSSWTFKNGWNLKKCTKLLYHPQRLDRIEGLWNQVQFKPLDFKRSKDGRSAYLVFILGNRVTLHAVYWRAPASSVALCDVLGGEQEEDNLFRWKLGRLGTWVLLLCVKRVIKIVVLRWASCPALGWVKMQQWLSVVLKDHLLGAEHDVKSSCQSQRCNSPHPTHSW